MAVANLKKAKALQDQAALSLFTIPIDVQLTKEATREYLNLRQGEEMERLKRCMEAEQRAAELEAMVHDCLMKERSAEVERATKCRGTLAAVTPIVPEMSPPITRGGGSPSTPLALPHPTVAMPGAIDKFATSTKFCSEFLSLHLHKFCHEFASLHCGQHCSDFDFQHFWV